MTVGSYRKVVYTRDIMHNIDWLCQSFHPHAEPEELSYYCMIQTLLKDHLSVYVIEILVCSDVNNKHKSSHWIFKHAKSQNKAEAIFSYFLQGKVNQ